MSNRSGNTMVDRMRYILSSSDRIQELAETLHKSYDEVEDDCNKILKDALAWSSPEAKERNRKWRAKRTARLNEIKDAIR